MEDSFERQFRAHAVYIIVDDGRCAYFKAFSELAPSPHLVSAMLTAMQVFIKEVTGSFFSEVTAGPFSFVSEKAGPFSVVLVSTKSSEALAKAKYLVLRFIRRYQSALDQWKGETLDFQNFDIDVADVFGNQEDIRIDPKIPLDSISLIKLKPNLQKVAKQLLTKEEVSVDQLAEELGESRFKVYANLNELFELGHVGRYTKDRKLIYFIR